MHFYDNGDNTATIALVSSEVGSYSVKVTVIDEHGAEFYWPVIFEVAEKSDEVLGCTDVDAENYNSLATVDDGSCTYACVDTDNDGVCDVDEVFGCTDVNAENYNALATEDDNSCTYGPGNQPPQLTINGMDEVYEGEELTFNVYVNDEVLDAADITAYVEECLIGKFICYNTDLPVGAEFNFLARAHGTLTWTPDYTFVTHPDLIEEITFVFVVDDGEFTTEEEVNVRIIDVNRIPELDIQTNEPFAENQDIQIDVIGSDADAEDSLDYEFNNVPSWLIVDINGDSVSISGVPSCSAAGLYEVEITVTDGIDSVTEVVTLDVAEACDLPVEGCTDPNAFNYNADANVDDGSCEAIVEGCTNPDAFNYNADANVDDGSCEAVVGGCTDVNAFNYNPNANVDDGSCEAIILGCTDSEAANYNPLANADDGSCVCVDLDNDGICDFEDTCVDQDNDGFCDYKDACPLEAEDFDNYLDEDGCPESHEDANIASVHLNSETAIPGDYLSMYIKMSNSGDTYFSGMRAEAIVYEWGQKAATGEFNLQPGQDKGRNLVMQVPYDTQPGDYLIKVTLKNDYYHESMYRLVTIY